jgi:hypothetical protein
MPACYACGKEYETPVGRRDSCSCDKDLHCCRNCQFYDPSAYNECHELQADRVMDKERSNFCDYFQAAPIPFSGEKKLEGAKKKLEELFKRK